MFISNSPGNPISIVVVAFFSGTVMSWTGLFTRAPIRKPTAAPTARSTMSKFRLITPIKDEQHLLQALLLLRKRPPNLLAITFTPFWASLRIEWMLINMPSYTWVISKTKPQKYHYVNNVVSDRICIYVLTGCRSLLIYGSLFKVRCCCGPALEYWILKNWTGPEYILKLHLWFNRTPKPTVVGNH